MFGLFPVGRLGRVYCVIFFASYVITISWCIICHELGISDLMVIGSYDLRYAIYNHKSLDDDDDAMKLTIKIYAIRDSRLEHKIATIIQHK